MHIGLMTTETEDTYRKESAMTPCKAIRAKCLDCCCGSAYEVKMCAVTDCALYPFRDGHNPNRKGLGNKSPNTSGLKSNAEPNNEKQTAD